MGKGNDPNCATHFAPMPAAALVCELRELVAHWLPQTAEELRTRALSGVGSDGDWLLAAARRLEAVSTRLEQPLTADDHQLLEHVALQLAYWDCDKTRSGKGTWLSLAADDLARLAAAGGT